MNKMKFAAIALLSSAIWSAQAGATEITVKYLGSENGYASGRIYGERDASVYAGQFRFEVKDDGGIYWDNELNAFCIDVGTNLVTNSNAVYDLIEASSSNYLQGPQLSLIGQLFDSYAGMLGTAVKDAAFQLSLWEIIYDAGNGLDLQTGTDDNTFSSNPFTKVDKNARDIAAGWLADLDPSDISYISSDYDLFVMKPVEPQQNQTLLTWKPVAVPEPGTLGMLGAGLIVVGALSRRRRRQHV